MFAQAWAHFWSIWEPNLIMDVGRYVIAASLMALILKFFWPKLRHRKIQTRFASDADIRREILASLRTGILFSLTGVLIAVCAMHGLFTVYMSIQPAGWSYFVVSVAAMILAQDAYFYWTHRLMHHPKLFRFFHRTHHQSVAPTPFAAYAFAIPEALVISAFVPLWLVFVPMHALGLFSFMAFQIVRNVMGHSGVELMPRRLADSRWFGWINTTTHHDLHHSTFNYNFGLYFTWWDKWMGTEHPAYRECLRGKRLIASLPTKTTAAWTTRVGSALALVIAVLIVSGDRAAASEQPNAVFGRWLTQSGNGIVEIYPCDNEFCGRLVWFNADAGIVKPAIESGRTGHAQPYPQCDMVMLRGLKLRDSQHLNRGWIYSPDSGDTYAVSLTLDNENVLTVRGYRTVSPFGLTHIWTRTWVRASGSADSCNED